MSVIPLVEESWIGLCIVEERRELLIGEERKELLIGEERTRTRTRTRGDERKDDERPGDGKDSSKAKKPPRASLPHPPPLAAIRVE